MNYDQLAAKFMWVSRSDRFRAILGREDGTILDPDNPGYIFVRVQLSDEPAELRSVRNVATLRMIPGAAVWLKYDEEGELEIEKADFSGQLGQLINPAINNPADRNIDAIVNQERIQTLLCQPTSPYSMEVLVHSWVYLINNVWTHLAEQLIDLTSYVPAGTDDHCLVGLFVDNTNTVVIGASTDQNQGDDLDLTDIQECYDAVSDVIAPIRFWRLRGGQTEVTETDAKFDGRQFINVVSSSGGSGGSSIIPIKRSWFGI